MTDQRAKSLRWLANQFPAVETPRDDTDRMQTCIHLYCAAGADAIETLTAQLAALQAETAEKDEEIEKLRMQVKVKDACISGKSSIITHMETERDAARPSAEVLEAIDELVEFARDRMSIGVWLGYVNVLNDWRGAQGEG